jgi:50S ribosomal protein L16 3-hydroxylase
LKVPRDPLEIADAMVAAVAALVEGVRWDRADVADFLGRFLTRPRPRQSFTRPRRALSEEGFARQVSESRAKGTLRLALPSRGLARRGRIYLNGEAHAPARAALPIFKQLLRARAIALPLGSDVGARALALLHGWYAAGWLSL